MARKIFIPQTCRVGFQKREGTFTNKLAYVIYYDSLGRLRKEASWQGWRHKDIDPWDFENSPTTGFMLNKGIQRYNWTHFGTGRSMIRIYDPRGIEFEITPDNLIGILMHTDCSRREIQGELVYAWCGTELMLLPCCSEEYQSASKYTALQAKKVSARELKEGLTYVTKKEQHIVYLGRRMWYEQPDGYRRSRGKRREGTKQHVFCDLQGKNFQIVSSVPSIIAAIADEHCHPQFSEWVDDFHKTEMSAEIVDWVKEPITLEQFTSRNWRDNRTSTMAAFIDAPNDEFKGVTITLDYSRIRRGFDPFTRRDQNLPPPDEDVHRLMYTTSYRTVCRDGTQRYDDGYYRYDPNRRETQVTIESIKAGMFFDLHVKFSNGITRKWG